MRAAICAFDDDIGPAQRLATALGLPLQVLDMHRFPDGESLPTAPGGAFDQLIVYRGLDRPDPKIMPLLLLADAASRMAVKRLILVAPYMPYLRQDTVFVAGQPVSRDVFAKLLGQAFDTIVTVQPHLHRTPRLSPFFGSARVETVPAVEVLAHEIGVNGGPVIVGPDSESDPWARAVAARLAAGSFSLVKTRLADRRVTLNLPPGIDVAGRRVVLIDDICSTGETLRAAARLLRGAGAASVEVAVAHALISAADLEALIAEGVSRFASTDSCTHPTNQIALAPLLARRLRTLLTCNG